MLRLAERAPPSRCALCHDERGDLAPCEECGTAFHGDCRKNISTCPTIGCAGRRPTRRTSFRSSAIFAGGTAAAFAAASFAVRAWMHGRAFQFTPEHPGPPGTRLDLVLACGLLVTAFAHTILGPALWSALHSRGARRFLTIGFLQVAFFVLAFAALPSTALRVLFFVEPLLACWIGARAAEART